MELQLDELAALIHYHSARLNMNGHLMPEAAKRIAELSAAIQNYGLTQAQINARKDTR